MELDALVHRMSLTIEPPSPGDTASDWERVVHTLHGCTSQRWLVGMETPAHGLQNLAKEK